MKLELTAQQRQAVAGQSASVPTDIVDPVSHREYVLIAREHYEQIRSALHGDSKTATLPMHEAAIGIPPGIRRSQESFWRDLSQLLSQKKLCGQWVCYHGDERIGVGTYEALIRECIRRSIPDDDYYLAIVEPRELPPWEPEDVEPLGSHHLEGCPNEP